MKYYSIVYIYTHTIVSSSIHLEKWCRRVHFQGRNRDTDTGNRDGEGEGGTNWEQFRHIHTTACKTESLWDVPVWHRELNSVLCDDLDEWDGCRVAGRSRREGIYGYI